MEINFEKISTENLEELAWACRNYSQYLMVYQQCAPLHLAAHHGNLSLYNKIMKKFKNKNPIGISMSFYPDLLEN